ncbi:hypothetical protein ACU4GD_18480 [Cupriavidus basilensis]
MSRWCNGRVALILAKQEPYPAVVLDRFWNAALMPTRHATAA